MGRRIYYNFKPITEHRKTIWIENKCECGEIKVICKENGDVICYNCKKIIEKGENNNE